MILIPPVFLANRQEYPIMPSRLMQTRLQVWDSLKCQYRYYNGQQQICVGESNMSSARICGGDGGGPLVTEVNGKWILFGITSYSHKRQCAHPEFGDGFTRIQYYRKWIYEQLKLS